MKPILIVGARGQLGHALARTYAGAAPLELRDKSQLDVTHREAVEAAIAKLQPSMLINCTAYNLVDAAEKDGGEAAYFLNADAVRRMAGAAARAGVTFVHFSTDYVFSGNRTTPWKETDPTAPLGAYARSKLEGEKVAAYNPKHFVFRVCGLYGVAGRRAERANFVERMLSLAAAGKTIRVVADQILTPSYAVDVAKAVWQALEKAEPLGRYGVYHATNGGQCSWFEFAQAVFELAGVKADLHATTLAEFAAPAPRPSYSVMANEGLRALGVPPLPHWKDGLKRYLAERGA